MEDAIIFLLFNGPLLLMVASPAAFLLLPLAWVRRRPYSELINPFLLFKVLLLGWGILGNQCWLLLTATRFRVLGDAPVWFLFLPPAPWMFDHAGGGRDAWELWGGTTFPQLYVLWAATAGSAWLFAGLSLVACRHWLRPALVRRSSSPG